MKYAAIAIVLCACTDPTIEMHLVLPSNPSPQMQDTSCVSAVEVHAIGKNYPQNPNDFTVSCLPITGATYGDIATAIHGKFELQIPPGGLKGVEMYGWSGPSACMVPAGQGFTPDLVFFSDSTYVGVEQIDLKVTPNLACQRSQVSVHMVDMMALLAGTPSSANCTTAAVPDGANTGADGGTLVPLAYTGSQWFGGQSGADQTSGLSTFSALTVTGARGCFALDAGNDTSGSESCVIGGNTVCAPAGDIEQAVMTDDWAQAALQFDGARAAKWGGILIGGVWSNATPRLPLSGVTVQVDASQGEVVYVDPQATPGFSARSQSSTGATGMFILYTNTLATVSVTAGTQTRSNIALTASPDSNANALIVMP